MTALIGHCMKVLAHGSLGVNAKSKNMITHKTSKLTSDTKIFHIYSAVFSKKSELCVLAFHKLYIDKKVGFRFEPQISIYLRRFYYYRLIFSAIFREILTNQFAEKLSFSAKSLSFFLKILEFFMKSEIFWLK